ncbi:hypothetical protein [Alkaliphilus transvaalensis]|uniref:hypothetical protein n=1 Tax=Alkaliphilus transvaalensis TaxID=114628 RepID=UPI00047C6A3E|nr:hypothetical protein [Alkaliphilus transvaalensis]
MSYNKTTWVDNETSLSAQNLNKIEQGIEDAFGGLEAHKAESMANAHKINNIGGLEVALNQKATTGTYTTTLNTTWVGTSAPYTKTQTVTGILSTDNPIVDVVMSGTYHVDEGRHKSWSYIYRITTDNNSVTLYANEKPSVNLPIQLKVVR